MSTGSVQRGVDAAIDAAIRAVLARLGLETRRVETLSPPNPVKRGRSAYCVDVVGGRRLKVRLLESARAARRLAALRVEPASWFAPPVACEGRHLVESWIEGRTPAAHEVDARAEEAGRALGALHGTASAEAGPVSTASWRRLAREELRWLAVRRRLDAREVAAVERAIERLDPGRAHARVAHWDFCPDNFVVDPAGRLRSVDNEWFMAAPAGYDLARTFSRWPMGPAVRAAFLRGYRERAPEEAGPLGFWEIAVALWTVRIRREHAPEGLADPVATLRRVAAPAAVARGTA